jgi:outer membrane protein assembly factor BamB
VRKTPRAAALAAALAIAACVVPAVAGAAPAACSTDARPGGDWSSYGQNLSNTRSQPQETTIATANVPTLVPAWTFTPTSAGGIGRLESTPVVAEGCAYVTTSSGFIYALNADTGALVWKDRLAEPVVGVCCGGTLFAPTVRDGVLYENVSHNPDTSSDKNGPFVIALDAHTGERLWQSEPVSNEPGSYTNSSAVYSNGLLIIGICNPEQTSNQTGGFAILDARDGAILKRTRTVPDDQFAAGMGGGSIWSTAAVDQAAKVAYVGTGQPSSWSGPESEFVNAIVKIDFDRASPTFGEIIDSYKGTWDDAPYIDVDMAASPTLLNDATGQQMVVNYQKSGWLHAARTRRMSAMWARPLSPIGTALGNYASQATDGTNVFAMATYPGQLFSVNATTGIPNWVVPIPTVLGANPVSYANGVVYYADGKGVLNAIDSATGAPILARPMSADAAAPCTNAGGGVSIARGTVFAVCGDAGAQAGIGPTNGESGWLIAYRPAA